MAKRPRRRNFAKYISGAIDHKTIFGGLAGNAVGTGLLSQTVQDTARVSSIRCTYGLSKFTALLDAGPIVCGVAHGDYTASEIEAYLEAAASWELGDKIAEEIRSRRVRIIGTFDTPTTALLNTRLNDGRPIRTKLNWVIREDQTLQFWVYNQGTATLTTTAPELYVQGKANLWAQ